MGPRVYGSPYRPVLRGMTARSRRVGPFMVRDDGHHGHVAVLCRGRANAATRAEYSGGEEPRALTRRGLRSRAIPGRQSARETTGAAVSGRVLRLVE